MIAGVIREKTGGYREGNVWRGEREQLHGAAAFAAELICPVPILHLERGARGGLGVFGKLGRAAGFSPDEKPKPAGRNAAMRIASSQKRRRTPTPARVIARSRPLLDAGFDSAEVEQIVRAPLGGPFSSRRVNH